MASLDRNRVEEVFGYLEHSGWTHVEALLTVHHPSFLQFRSRIALQEAPEERFWINNAMDMAFMSSLESYGLRPLSPLAMEGLSELFSRRSDLPLYWKYLREPNYDLWRILSKRPDLDGARLETATNAGIIMRMAVLECC